MAQVSFSDLVDGVIHTAAHHNDRFNALKSRINAIQSDNLEDSSVTGPKIAMGSDAQGDILIRGVTSYQRLAAGTSGQFLKTLGAGASPLWADVVDKAGTAISSLIIKAIYFSDTTTVNKTIGGSHTVAKNATGDYTITWAGTAFADANYIVVGSGNRIAGNQIITIGISTRTTTTTRVYGVNGGSGDTNITDGFLIAIGT